MARPKADANRIKSNLGLVTQVDNYAGKLMDVTADGTVDERQAVLASVTKWIGVRHKLIDVEDMDGAGLSTYRAAFEGPRPVAARGGTRVASRLTADQLAQYEFSGDLAKLAERLPDAAAGGAGRDSPRAWGKDDSPARSPGWDRLGVPGNGDGDPDDDRGGGDL